MPIEKCDTDHIHNLFWGNKYWGIYRSVALSGNFFGVAIMGYPITYNGYLAQVTIADPRYGVLPAGASRLMAMVIRIIGSQRKNLVAGAWCW